MNFIRTVWQILNTSLAKFYIATITRTFKHTPNKTILFIVPWLTFGGAEKVNLDIMQGLKEDGWDIFVVTTKEKKHEWQDKFEGIGAQVIHIEGLPAKFHTYLLIQIIRRLKVDLGFISNSFTGYIATPHISTYIPIVDLLHGEGGVEDNGGAPKFASTYDKFISKRIVISNHIKELLINGYKTDPEKINVIHNGIDISLTLEAIDESLLTPDEKAFLARERTILWLARLSYEKQPLEVIKLAEQMPEFNFMIAGGGGELEQKVKRASSSMSNVLLTGQVSNEKAKTILKNSDVLLMTSQFEGMPMAILEAMCLSKPVVATDVGAIDEMVDSKSGFLVDPTLIQEEMPKAIATAIENSKEMGDEGFRIVKEKFKISAMHSQYLSVFNFLLKK